MQQVSASDFLQVNINTIKFNQWISQVIKHLNGNQEMIQINREGILNLNAVIAANKQQISVEIESIKKNLSVFIEHQNALKQQYARFFNQKMEQITGLKSKVNTVILVQLNEIRGRVDDFSDNFNRFQQEYANDKNQLRSVVFNNRQNIQFIEQELFQTQSEEQKQKGETQTNQGQQIKSVANQKEESHLLNVQTDKKDIKRTSRNCSKLFSKKQLLDLSRKSMRSKTKRLKKTAYFSFDRNQFFNIGQQQIAKPKQTSQTFNKILYTSRNSSRKNICKNQIVQQYIPENQPVLSSPKINKISMKSLNSTQNNAQMNKKILEIQNTISQSGRKQHELLQYYRNKVAILEQKVQQFNKKIDRETYKINQFKILLKKFEESRVDEKVISEFKGLVDKNKIQYELMICKKVQIENYQKDLSKIRQRIGLSQSELYNKADKDQVKKAIMFIQAKIKEIIFVVTQSSKQQKLGAIGKIPIKCLTCDKQVAKMTDQSRFKTGKMKVQLPTRCQSGHIRRKIKCDTISKSVQTGYIQ